MQSSAKQIVMTDFQVDCMVKVSFEGADPEFRELDWFGRPVTALRCFKKHPPNEGVGHVSPGQSGRVSVLSRDNFITQIATYFGETSK